MNYKGFKLLSFDKWIKLNPFDECDECDYYMGDGCCADKREKDKCEIYQEYNNQLKEDKNKIDSFVKATHPHDVL